MESAFTHHRQQHHIIVPPKRPHNTSPNETSQPDTHKRDGEKYRGGHKNRLAAAVVVNGRQDQGLFTACGCHCGVRDEIGRPSAPGGSVEIDKRSNQEPDSWRRPVHRGFISLKISALLPAIMSVQTLGASRLNASNLVVEWMEPLATSDEYGVPAIGPSTPAQVESMGC